MTILVELWLKDDGFRVVCIDHMMVVKMMVCLCGCISDRLAVLSGVFSAPE